MDIDIVVIFFLFSSSSLGHVNLHVVFSHWWNFSKLYFLRRVYDAKMTHSIEQAPHKLLQSPKNMRHSKRNNVTLSANKHIFQLQKLFVVFPLKNRVYILKMCDKILFVRKNISQGTFISRLLSQMYSGLFCFIRWKRENTFEKRRK